MYASLLALVLAKSVATACLAPSTASLALTMPSLALASSSSRGSV